MPHQFVITADVIPNWAERMTGVSTLLLAIWTFGLMLATGCLATYAFRALNELETAVEELEESKRDRHVSVFADFGRRWEGAEITEALILSTHHTPESLRDLWAGDSQVVKTRAQELEEARQRIILLRIPSYFEDAAIIATVGKLEDTRFRENFGGIAVEAWQQWQPTIDFMQATDPQSFCEFRRLAETVEAEDCGERESP